MTVAPIVAARFTAAPRSVMFAEFASTRRILQFGQAAEAMSRSSAISPAQPLSAVGSGLAAPFWFTFLKQPLAVVQAGRPYWARDTPRSFSAFGSACASRIATVFPEPPDVGMAYAETRSGGPKPLGVAKFWIVPSAFTRTRAWQAISPGSVGAAHTRLWEYWGSFATMS